MSETLRFRTNFDSQHAKGCERLLKYGWWQFYLILLPLCGKKSMKMTLLVISEILGLFVSTLNADDKYSLRNSNNLPQPIQMQLSNQKKNFPKRFAPFLRSTSKFLTFSNKR